MVIEDNFMFVFSVCILIVYKFSIINVVLYGYDKL